MSRSEPTDFVIEILEGPQAGRLLRLSGRELPFRAGGNGSISFGGELTVKTTWYAGNPIASQQVVGRKLDPTTINGIWKEHFIGADRPIELVEQFEALRDSGVQLLVSWSTVIRTGVLQKFTWKPGMPTGGLGDIGWEAAFAWNGDGVPRPPAQPIVAPFDLASSAERLVGAAQTLSEAVKSMVDLGKSAGVGGLTPVFAAEVPTIEAATLDAEDAVRRVSEATRQAAVLAEIDRTLAALAIADGEDSARAADQVGDQVAELSIGALTGSDDADKVVVARLEVVGVTEASIALAADAIRFRDQIEEAARPAAALRVPAVEGTDLRQYAARYYGDADLWAGLAEANGLWDSLIPAGLDFILIPERLDARQPDRRTSRP